MHMRLFKNLKAKILKSIITWSTMGKPTARAKEVYYIIHLFVPSLSMAYRFGAILIVLPLDF